ncbi:MAG TPA: hypothetical protein VFW23_15595 [Tepidisphaeraceae bacterium]|nr:hypothetical protein [Tepidisphaeraceae bacterium]
MKPVSSALVSATASIPKLHGWRVTSREWWETQAKRHELYISAEVVAELSAPDFQNSSRATEMLRGLSVLELTPEVGNLAELLVENKVMPGPANRGDALHVAVATIHSMDYILTWKREASGKSKQTNSLCYNLHEIGPGRSDVGHAGHAAEQR